MSESGFDRGESAMENLRIGQWGRQKRTRRPKGAAIFLVSVVTLALSLSLSSLIPTMLILGVDAAASFVTTTTTTTTTTATRVMTLLLIGNHPWSQRGRQRRRQAPSPCRVPAMPAFSLTDRTKSSSSSSSTRDVVCRSSKSEYSQHLDSNDDSINHKGDQDNVEEEIIPPSYIQSPVLRQVYPSLIRYKTQFGHPNIPLGTTDGKKCKTLRRLQVQDKLLPEEITLLENLGFRFNSLEDIYDEADFDELLQRLIEYEEANKTNYQIPKKYKPDPELGAWVTAIRRLGPDRIAPNRRKALDDIHFTWISTRKCGSSFMKNYRAIKERLEECGGTAVLEDVMVKKWINAQREVYEKGNLSETRVDYMDKLGVNWREPL